MYFITIKHNKTPRPYKSRRFKCATEVGCFITIALYSDLGSF